LLDRTVVRVPGIVVVNDTSLNSPTSHFYNWSDGQANSTFNNGTHLFGLRGGYNISHTAINSAGSNTSYKMVRVIGGMQGLVPTVADRCVYSVSRELDALERLMTDCKICGTNCD